MRGGKRKVAQQRTSIASRGRGERCKMRSAYFFNKPQVSRTLQSQHQTKKSRYSIADGEGENSENVTLPKNPLDLPTESISEVSETAEKLQDSPKKRNNSGLETGYSRMHQTSNLQASVSACLERASSITSREPRILEPQLPKQ